MATSPYRIYNRGSRAPRDFLGTVPGTSEDDAKQVWISMARSKRDAKSLDAVAKPVGRKVGK